MPFLVRWLVNAAALWVATRIVSGVTYTGGGAPFFGVALLFGVVNALIPPLPKVPTFPLLLQPPDCVATQSLEIDGRRQRRSCDETVVLKRAHRERRAEGVEDTASHRWPLTRQRACQIQCLLLERRKRPRVGAKLLKR